MTELKDLIWSEEGYVTDCITEKCPEYIEEWFLPKGGVKPIVAWFNKYSEESFFKDEIEAIKDALDWAADRDHDEECNLLEKRLKELEDKQAKKQTGKKSCRACMHYIHYTGECEIGGTNTDECFIPLEKRADE